MTNATRKLLLDVCEAGESIFRYTEGKGPDDYFVDRQLRRAVEREFEIIGEALSRLERLDPTTAQHITDLRVIIGFRNRITHGYDTVDHVVVWGVIHEFLPSLILQARYFLESPSGE